MITKCVQCFKNKKRIFVSKWQHGDKKYVDVNGKCWNGRRCPDCQSITARINMKKYRDIKKIESFTHNASKGLLRRLNIYVDENQLSLLTSYFSKKQLEKELIKKFKQLYNRNATKLIKFNKIKKGLVLR